MKHKWLKRVITILIIIVAVIWLLGKWLFPPYEPSIGSGNYKVQTQNFTWEDKNRVEAFTDTGENRALTVGIWYPEEEGKYPLVVFSHGAFGVLESNVSTYMELASNGYVVASIAHPYHAAYVEDVNGKVTIGDMEFMQQIYADNSDDSAEAEKRIYEFSLEWMALRSADMNFVLDTILEKVTEGENPFVKIDTEKIGVMGHSMGGATAVQIGRERNDIDAVIDLEGTMQGEYVGFDGKYEIYNEEPYPVPVLDVNSKAVREQIDQIEEENPGWEYVNDYLGKNAMDYREVIFKDAGHLNFTDLPMFSPILAKLLGVGDVNPEECMANVNEMVRIYFDYYLKGQGSLENIKVEY